MANKEVIILQSEDGKFKGKMKKVIDGTFLLIRAEVEQTIFNKKRIEQSKLTNAEKKEFNLDEIILEIVRRMQPISSEEVWMEIGENLEFESNLSQEEINQRLDKMEKENILGRSSFKNDEEKYVVVEK